MSRISIKPSKRSRQRPVIGIVGATERLDDVPTQVVRNVYVEALARVAEVDAMVLPVNQAVHANLLSRVDGLILTGAITNVHPARYGKNTSLGEYDLDRDNCSLAVLRQAVALRIPTLAICRGLQEMAVAFGGTLRTLPARSAAIHVEDTSIPRDIQYLPAHTTTVDPGGLLERICGAGEFHVNSLHRQAIETLGPVLRREAVAPDGVVEAVSLPDGHPFMLGVQWHPEWHADSDPTSQVLLQAFGTAAREHSSAPPGVGEG